MQSICSGICGRVSINIKLHIGKLVVPNRRSRQNQIMLLLSKNNNCSQCVWVLVSVCKSMYICLCVSVCFGGPFPSSRPTFQLRSTHVVCAMRELNSDSVVVASPELLLLLP